MLKLPENKIIPPSVFDEHLAELGQAKTRLWMTLASICYLALRWVGIDDPISLPANKVFIILPFASVNAVHLILFFLGYGVFGLIMLAIIRQFPGNFMWRRLATMFGDYGMLTYAMIVGGQVTMPFFALILWIAVGNGMRFGTRYLVIAATCSQASLAALVIFSPFWLDNIGIILTFSITAIALPAYALVLLRHTANARDAALMATQAKSRFLAQASHDLRQPIHAIGYYLDILREAGRKSERTQLIDRIERALGSVAGLFKSLLDIARLDSGNIEVNAQQVSVQHLLVDIIDQNEQVAHWNNVELRFVSTQLSVYADHVLLANMVQNLLSNAIKYAKGSAVLIGVRRNGGTLAIEVHDQGIGIAAEHLPYIFDEFYRAHVAGDHDAEGVGLGLSIVNRSAQLSGFVLGLKSQRGVGTSAGIYGIPINAAPVEKPLLAKAAMPQPFTGFRVILIEDDRDVLDATRRLLERWGCAVQAHPGLPTTAGAADLIIADFDLGNDVRGTDVIAAIRKILGVAVPAILLTGHADTVVVDQSDNLATQIIAKPVQPAMLRSILSAFRITSRHQS